MLAGLLLSRTVPAMMNVDCHAEILTPLPHDGCTEAEFVAFKRLPIIDQVRTRFRQNLSDYPRFCTCLRETFAEFTGEPGDEFRVPTPADAAACFPEFNAH